MSYKVSKKLKMKFSYASWNDFTHSKIQDSASLKMILDDVRHQSKYMTVATLNGSFDLLHAGHMYMIYEASQVADILILALNTDKSIQRYKHISRPLIPLQQRMEMIAALAVVDYVTWFDETDPRELLKLLRPDIHVNGIEYGTECIEAQTVRQIGATLHLVKRIPGLATSNILSKIQMMKEQNP